MNQRAVFGGFEANRGDAQVTDVTRPVSVAIVCSRLGHDVDLHRHVGCFLRARIHYWSVPQVTFLVARGSAIAPWIGRASELFQVPLIEYPFEGTFDAGSLDGSSLTDTKDPDSDTAVIQCADFVDVAYVRRGGRIERALSERMDARNDFSTCIAPSQRPRCAAGRLIRRGALAWDPEQVGRVPIQHGQRDEAPGIRDRLSIVSDQWMDQPGEWLVHCTRGVHGPWPDETINQYRDAILLGTRDATRRGPADALARILACGRLIASSATTRQRVLCLSAVPLKELLRRRCFRSHLGRWDYEPYGIAIRLSAAKAAGCQPVIYGPPEQYDQLDPAQRFRFHPHGRNNRWDDEREWRSPNDLCLSEFCADDLRVFAPDETESIRALSRCKWPLTLIKVPPDPGDQHASESR